MQLSRPWCKELAKVWRRANLVFVGCLCDDDD